MKRALLAAGLLLFPVMAAAVEQSDGKALFEARCANCHQLPDPRQLKAAQWEKVLVVMQQRMKQSGMMAPDDEEMGAIRDYLRQEARE